MNALNRYIAEQAQQQQEARAQETLAMPPFTLYWRGGKKQVVHGADPADAMNRAGIGAGALRALDFYAPGDDTSWTWDDEARDWKNVECVMEREQPSH